MRSELDYFACSLISGLNDGTATLNLVPLSRIPGFLIYFSSCFVTDPRSGKSWRKDQGIFRVRAAGGECGRECDGREGNDAAAPGGASGQHGLIRRSSLVARHHNRCKNFISIIAVADQVGGVTPPPPSRTQENDRLFSLFKSRSVRWW